jgi:predicted nucleic acid-binding Zn ribbon protein
MTRMTRADRIIPAVLSDVIRKAPLCDEKVEFAWRSAVGPAVARVTHVRLDSRGALHVTAADARWSQEVKRESRLIVARLAALLGDGVVKTLKV